MNKQCFFIFIISLQSTFYLFSATSEQIQKEDFHLQYLLDTELPVTIDIMHKNVPKTDKGEASIDSFIQLEIPINETNASFSKKTPLTPLLKQGLLQIIWLLVEQQGLDYSTLTPLLHLKILEGISEKSPKKSHDYNFSWKPEQELSDCLTSNGIIFHVGNKTIADTITLLYYHLIDKGAQSIKASNRKTIVRPYKKPVQHREHISQKDFMQTFNHHKTENPQLFEQTEKMAQILFDTLQQPTKDAAQKYLMSKQGELQKAFHAAKKAATPTQVYFTKPFIFGSSVLFISALLGYFAYQKYRMK